MRSLIAALTAFSLLLSGCSTVQAKSEEPAAIHPVMVAAAMAIGSKAASLIAEDHR